MIHIRIDNEEFNSKRRFACGVGPELPEGDTYWFEHEGPAYHQADCPGCNPGGPKPYGTPISQLSGRPGEPGRRHSEVLGARLMTDSFPAFPADSRARKKLLGLISGKGPSRVDLKWDDVHAGGKIGLEQLTAFVAEHNLGYGHDPFRDEWRISRPTTGKLFARSA